MHVTQLEVKNFRNIREAAMEPCRGVNLIWGNNAQGKTNLLESIWLFTGCRSFRGAKDSELIGFGSENASLYLDYYGAGREQSMLLEIEKSRQFTHNGIRLRSPSKITGEFLAVVFSPVHLSLVKEGPLERRRFLDAAISQLKPNYAQTLASYHKAVQERNVLLKDAAFHRELFETMDVWEERIAFYGSEIIRQRIGYVRRLQQFCEEIYGGISGKKELLEVGYEEKCPTGGLNRQEIYEGLKNLLFAARKPDMIAGATSVGPHRDDLSIRIDSLSARAFGSQGQQRSAALALKLAEAAVIKNFTDDQPVALLDDVMSELDASRQNYILNHIRDWQVFSTCCEPGSVKNLKYGKAFQVQSGVLKAGKG